MKYKYAEDDKYFLGFVTAEFREILLWLPKWTLYNVVEYIIIHCTVVWVKSCKNHQHVVSCCFYIVYIQVCHFIIQLLYLKSSKKSLKNRWYAKRQSNCVKKKGKCCTCRITHCRLQMSWWSIELDLPIENVSIDHLIRLEPWFYTRDVTS